MATPAPTNPVDDYATQVVSGEVPAGKYHRLACARHLGDRQREKTSTFPFCFDPTMADRFFRFARKMKHYKGRQFAGQFFEPTPNQVFRLGSIFGWRHAVTKLRRFTTAYNELPRKQGKSFEAAVVSVYATFFEGEPGAEGYCIATKEKQARIVFDAAKRLVTASGLSSRIKVNASNLHRLDTLCKLEPLGSDSDTTDGLNPHFIGVDELHAFKRRGLLDVVESATGARLNFLNFQITTAGDDPVSPCGDQHDYACRILDGVLEDDPSTVSFFAFIAHADAGDDPWAEATWQKANPHWDISINPEDLRKLAAKAQKMPAAAAEFKQKRLNIWVNAIETCLSVDGWRAGQSDWDESELEGLSCWIGIDLASKIDLCALTAAFPPTPTRPRWRWIQRIWTPEATMKDRAHRDRVPYDIWAGQGWLRTRPGTRLDHAVAIREELAVLRKRFRIESIGFDPWHVDTLANELKDQDGFSETMLIEVPQTYAHMSSACLKVQADILAGEIDARRCPVTAYAIASVVANKDGKDNLMFAKGRSRGRIDPLISGTIATARWLHRPEAKKPRRGPRGIGKVWTPAGFQEIQHDAHP
ncbi:MAG: terminase large subunit [Vicinamibacterales bacterium]